MDTCSVLVESFLSSLIFSSSSFPGCSAGTKGKENDMKATPGSSEGVSLSSLLPVLTDY